MEIQDRMKMIMKMHHLTASSFADTIGVQRSSISHIMSGRNKPSLDFIEKTLSSFPRVDAGWLITGKQTKVAQVDPLGQQKNKLEEKSAKEEELVSTKIKKEQPKTIAKIIVFYSDGTFEER